MNDDFVNGNIENEELNEISSSDSEIQPEATVPETAQPTEQSAATEAQPTAPDTEFRPNPGAQELHSRLAGEQPHAEQLHTEQQRNEPQNHGFTVTQRVNARAKRRWPRVIALALVAGLVAGASFGFANSLSTKLALSKVSIGSTDVALTKTSSKSDNVSNVSSITEACMPSIVAITNKSVSDVMTFFGKYSQESTSTGSGIIIGKNDSELLIVTNYHVVANSKALSVIFSSVENQLESQNIQSDLKGEGGSTQGSDITTNASIPAATVKGYNSDKDLAVIAVALKDISADTLSEIKVATIGDSSKLKAGDQVVAIGNALGYGQSVTTGIISATNRKISMESSENGNNVTNAFIQTDAAINPGNSGGALLNMAGEVIGINSVKIASSGVEGMGYAIPITDVSNIIDELMVKKTRSVVDESKQGFLGITGADVSASASQAYGLPTGVFVNSVMKDLAAEKAGIKKGYVITAFDGYTISSIAQLQDRLTYYKSGEKVKVTVQVPEKTNEYKEKEFSVTLSNRAKATKDAEQNTENNEANK